MASQLFTPPSRALDIDANPYSGAKWYFYATQSLTPQAVYTTSALNVQHANPVVADAGGKFPAMYFNSGLTYRGILKNSDGSVTLHDFDPINNATGAGTGSGNVGFRQSGIGTQDETIETDLRGVMVMGSSFTGVDSTGVTNSTVGLQAWIDNVKTRGGIGKLTAGTYKIGELNCTGSNYKLEFEPGVILQQVTGLTGDSDWHSVITIDGDDIELSGKISFTGNISTDQDEYSPCVRIVSGSTGIRLGELYGTNIRGDVLYIEGKTADTLTDVYVERVSGSNVYRNLVSIAGGSLTFGEIIHDGPVGYEDFLMEPNPGGTYRPSSAVGKRIQGGVVGVVSADTALQNDIFSVDVIDLDGSRIADSTPAYPSAPGVNAIALPLSYVRYVNIGFLKIRNYASYPVSLASNWDYIHIGKLDVATSNSTETTFHSVIVQQGTPGNGLLDIGYVKCVHTSSAKWLVRADTAGLKVRIGAGVISGGKLSVCCVLDITGMVLDAGSASGPTANIIVNGPLSNIRNLSLTNASSATLLHSSSNCTLIGVTGTVNAIVTSASNTVSINNSVINGYNIHGQIVSSDAPSTIAVATALPLPPLNQDTVEVTGTGATVTSITNNPFGITRIVTLKFSGASNTITDGNNISLNSNFSATPDDTLTLLDNGSSYTEISRSNN